MTKQAPIFTITLNPALDLASAAPRVVPGEKLRCALPEVAPGGGGVNVARAVRILGGTATVFVALGGGEGQRYHAALVAEGIAPEVFELPGETRQSVSVRDEESGAQFRFVLPGPVWDDSLVDAALARLATQVPVGAFVVLSGSQPPGVPDDFPQRLGDKLVAKHARLILDTSDGPMRMAAKARGLFVLRLDYKEAQALAGQDLPSRVDLARFAAELQSRGVAEIVVLAKGPDGSVMASADGRFHAATEDTPVLSKVGAGDSFVGAFTLALARGDSPQQALLAGGAAASAAVMTPGSDLCRAADQKALMKTAALSAV